MAKLLWVDLEMSGLDVETCRILEVAAIVTDEKLRELDSFAGIIRQPDFVLEAMDEWCQKTHGESGLTAAVKTGVPETEMELRFLDFINKNFSPDERPILAGNSIFQDRKFIDAYWPKIARRLHYRMLDVTSFKIVFQALGKPEFSKQGSHRALDDIRESMGELRHYLALGGIAI